MAELSRLADSTNERRQAELDRPRRLHGRPDLSGVWEVERTPAREYARVLGPRFNDLQVDAQDVTKYVTNLFWDLKPEEQPLRPEAVAIMKQRTHLSSPTVRCLPAGVPLSAFIYLLSWSRLPAKS